MARDITPERVVQMIALFRDHDIRAEKMVLDMDPWQKDEMLWKLLAVTDWVLDKAAEDREITGDEILWDILDQVNGIHDERN